MMGWLAEVQVFGKIVFIFSHFYHLQILEFRVVSPNRCGATICFKKI